jgi:3-hydroxyisobutyrate dehydrogenase-like beta-hydroxyacid dehydrogenase
VSTRVAIIGVGRMGGPIADHVIKAGHTVRVYDPSPDAIQPRVAAGAIGSASPGEAAADAELVMLVVFDDAQVRSVLTGADGVFAHAAPATVVSIHSSVAIETIEAMHAAGQACGVEVLDAGISGGESGAAAGTLVTMVGGDAAALERARPVFDAFSKEVVHAGGVGAGMALKLARNAASYAMMSALNEAMELAVRNDIDLALLRHVIEATDACGMAFTPFALGPPGVMPADTPAGWRSIMEHTLRLADKDLEQALALARRCGADVPVFEQSHRTFHRVVRL